MQGIKENVLDVKIISPEQEQCFFGYYDLCSYDSTGEKHLCHRVSFVNKIPEKHDVAELGILHNGKFDRIAETTAWNFQQGALLQYDRNSDHIIYYNVWKENGFSTVVHNLESGEKKYLPRAAATISPNGRYALSINFSRIFDFRPGYGYAGEDDAYAGQNRPTEDGIFLMDIQTGDCRLIIDYERIFREFLAKDLGQEKMVVNHITFNETSDRFVFLLRNFPREGGDWGTTVITSDLEGNMHMLLENKFFSHYCWKGGKQILAFCTPKDKPGLYLLEDLKEGITQLKSPYPHGPFGGDIHCLYSPDKRYILGDGYPDADGYRPLYYYDTQTERIDLLVKSQSMLDGIWDNRCDLHARFNRKGNKISFDSTHDGIRHVCEMNL